MSIFSSIGKSLKKAFSTFKGNPIGSALGMLGLPQSSTPPGLEGPQSFLGGAFGDMDNWQEAWDSYTGRDVALKNYELQKKQFAYQQRLNALQMNREDTAMVRKVADLKNAGLNPVLAANGTGAPSAPLKAAPAPQMENTSGATRETVGMLSNLVFQAISMKKDFALKDAEIQKLKSEKDYTDTLRGKAAAETTGLNIDNETRGAMNEAKLKSFDLDNSLKSGTLQNNILMSYKKLDEQDIINNNRRLEGMLTELRISHEDVMIIQDQLKNKLYVQDYEKGELELTAKTIAILKAAAEYNTYLWDVDFYHNRYNLPYGFNLSQGVLGTTIPQVAAGAEKVWSGIKNFFNGVGSNDSINNLLGSIMDYCGSTVDGLKKVSKQVGTTKDNLIWSFRRGDDGVRRNKGMFFVGGRH